MKKITLALSILALIASTAFAQEPDKDTLAKKATGFESTVAKVEPEKKFTPLFDRKASPAISKKRSAPAGAYDWSGAYIGGQVGYGWGNGDTRFEPLPSATQFVNLQPTTLKPDPKGWTGGFQGGFNGQWGNFVAGAESSISWSNIKGTRTQTPIVQNNGTNFPGAGFISATHDTSWFGTLRGRGGVAINRVLIYGTAGLAYGKVNQSATTDFRPVGTTQYPASISKTQTGWTGGFGVEIGINRHWSWRSEYLYFDLGKTTTTVNATPNLPPFQMQYTWQSQFNTFNTGFNFRF